MGEANITEFGSKTFKPEKTLLYTLTKKWRGERERASSPKPRPIPFSRFAKTNEWDGAKSANFAESCNTFPLA